jgi:hypothetical protein
MHAPKHEEVVYSEHNTLRSLEATVERLTGQKADALRNQTITELRRNTETKVKGRLKFSSRFPLIGRGNVMRDCIVGHEAVEALLKRILE